MSAVNFASSVSGGSDAQVVQVHNADDILSCAGSVLFNDCIVAVARHDELVLAWLTPVDVIVGVEERAITHDEGQVKSLMHNGEASIFVDFFDFDMFVVLWHKVVLVVKKLDKFLRRHSVCDDFEHCERRVDFPSLVDD